MKLEYDKLYATVTFETKFSSLNKGVLVLCSRDTSYFTIRDNLTETIFHIREIKTLLWSLFEVVP